jgi:replicative DNA helicase
MPKPVEIPESLHAALPINSWQPDALAMVKRAHTFKSGFGLAGLPTHLKAVDAALGGLQPGLHILAAEPGAGKTALALQIARVVAAHGIPALYASFDESCPRLALKTLAAAEKVSFGSIANGEMSPESVKAIWDKHAEKLAPLSFLQADARLAPTELAEQMKAQQEFWGDQRGLIIIDYLQPWAAAMVSGEKIELRAAVGSMALALRKIALQMELPLLLISAQNRTGQGTNNMTSLRESSDLEYGADTILLLTKAADIGSSYGRKLFIAKNRYGPSSMEIQLEFSGRTQTLTETNQF